MKKVYLITSMVFLTFSALGQKQIDAGDKLVFVYFEKREHNFIAIPNTGKLYSFKIFRKLKNDSTFQFVVEKKKPLLPMRYNITQYGVTWEDTEYHSRELEYKVIAFDKKGNELCEMIIMWDEKTPTNE